MEREDQSPPVHNTMSSSPSFPLLQLPLLPLLDVLKNMNPIDFLAFSLISRRSKAIAVELKYPLETCSWVFGSMNMICLETDSEEKKAHLTFLREDYQRDLMSRNKELAIVKLNGQDIRIFLDRQRWIIDYDPQSESESLMDKFTEHIFTVFRFKEYGLHAFRRINIVECFVWKNTTTLKHLFINDRFELTDSGIQFVMEQLKVAELTVKSLRMENRYVYDRPLTIDYLELPRIDWISRESIRSMKCQRFLVCGSLAEEKWNTMLKDWQQGGLADLEKLFSRLFRADMDKILEGIETFDWNPKKRPQCWRNELFDQDFDLSTPNCKDIVRADGTLATVRIEDDRSQLELFVWHPKFLNQ